jgi:4-hydroxy-tetrahydrodipicolinate reductase
VTRIVVAGATGKLGRVVCAAIDSADDLNLVARVAPSLAGAPEGYADVESALRAVACDAVFDATTPTSVAGNLEAAIHAGVDCVFATSGLDHDALRRLGDSARNAGVRLFYAPNFALGAVVMIRLAEQAARHFGDCEIIELHADTKRDRPSGTAIHTADRIEAVTSRRPPTHSVRLPGLVAHQEIVFGAAGQTLTIRHDTTSREAFVPGVLLALRRLAALESGLTIGLDTLI